MVVAMLIVSLDAKEMDAKELISKMIDAYGGKEKVALLNSYEQFWTIQSQVRDMNGTDSRKVILPSYLYTHIQYPTRSQTRILDKDRGVKHSNGTGKEVNGAMLDAMRLQLFRLYSPLELDKHATYIKVLDDKEYYILSLKIGNTTTNYYLLKGLYLIDKVVGELKVQGKSMKFTTLYRDYRSVEGVQMPHLEIKYASDINTAIMRLKATRFKR